MAIPDLQGALWAWVQTLPPWQSDLLRRLTTLEDVSDDDIEDATTMMLGFFGVGDAEAKAPVPIPALTVPVTHRVTRILALKDLVAVGSIGVGQRLDFVPDGLTIVYGETGSGKSSYARVLRKACRSSAKPIEILPNVLAPGTARAGTAEIEISQDGSFTLLTRDVNAAPEADLAEVSVFDSDSAQVYAGEESEITYTPSSLRLFERVVSFQAQIRKRIEVRAAQLNATAVPADGFDPTTRAGALVSALNENVSAETVDALAIVTPAERIRLDDLRAQVLAAKTLDPTSAAAQLDKRASAVADLADALENLAARVGTPVIGDLRSASPAPTLRDDGIARTGARRDRRVQRPAGSDAPARAQPANV